MARYRRRRVPRARGLAAGPHSEPAFPSGLPPLRPARAGALRQERLRADGRARFPGLAPGTRGVGVGVGATATTRLGLDGSYAGGAKPTQRSSGRQRARPSPRTGWSRNDALVWWSSRSAGLLAERDEGDPDDGGPLRLRAHAERDLTAAQALRRLHERQLEDLVRAVVDGDVWELRLDGGDLRADAHAAGLGAACDGDAVDPAGARERVVHAALERQLQPRRTRV